MQTPGSDTGASRALRPATDRERFLTFALAAAEMLVEAGPEGRIRFAAGAFQSRFGEPPEHWTGRHVRDLIALPDRLEFDRAFAALVSRDRLPPTGFRLADGRGTPMAIGGLRMMGQQDGRVCLTLAAPPHAPASPASLGAAPGLRAALEAEARAGAAPATLGLIEIRRTGGTAGTEASLDALVRDELGAALADRGLAGDLGPGRFGLVCPSAEEVSAVTARIGAMLSEAGHDASVGSTSLSLDAEALTPIQASRALRYALSAFAEGGARALSAAGFGGGLPGFVEAALGRAEWLRQAIDGRRFSLAFQPIVGLADGQAHHYEALLRPAADPGAPVQGPQDFVTFAETVGLSEALDWAVLGAVCGAARAARGACIAANVSGYTLQSPSFRRRLLALLDAEPILIRRLLIEITETAEIEDEAEAVATVEALRARGLPLCIDDFGAGAAAFRYLRTFRVDYVKIDGLYVTNALHGAKDRGIVAGMVELARTVGAQVVAERIETEAEAALMRELGVEYGQGWLFGKPGPLPGR